MRGDTTSKGSSSVISESLGAPSRRRVLYLRNNIGDDDDEQILMFAVAHRFFTTSRETPTRLDEFCPMPSSLNIHLADQNKQQWVAPPPAPRCQRVVHVGFTCDSYSRCRVVRIVEIFEAEPAALYLTMEIFSSETGEWIETVVACPQGSREVNYVRADIDAFAYKGTLYWLTLDGSLLGLELDYSNNKHRCRLISKRSPDRGDLNQAYITDCLGVCRGYLRLFRLYPGPSCTLYVWELKEEDEAGRCKMMKWCLKERVVLDKLASELESFRPLAFDRNDEDLLYLWRIPRYTAASHGPMVMCNIRTMTVTEISQKLPCRFRIDAFPFVLPRWRWPTPVPRLEYRPQRQNNPN
ncbi:hypothetical protein M0R45_010932 [Rubus argutus]|uniref:F-box protein At3g26010-like beta-propeller domain-containing protein n=1 Tax=Rubus argutus TaxID=59490 RepID=A0AAW1Y8I5_RUBAR